MKRNQLWHELTSGFEDDPLYRAEEIATDIAMEVDKRLDEYGLSRKELANKLEVSRSYVTQLLNGPSNMTLRTLCKLAYALELQVNVDLHPRERHAMLNSADSIFAHLVTKPAFEFDASAGFLASASIESLLGRSADIESLLGGSVTISGGSEFRQKPQKPGSAVAAEVEQDNLYQEGVA